MTLRTLLLPLALLCLGSLRAAAAPATLMAVPGPGNQWIAERRLIDDAWRGRIVSADGTRAMDLGPLIYPIRWSSGGDSLHAVRLVDDGHVLLEAGWVVVVDGVVRDRPGSAGSALVGWRGVYLVVDAGDADDEKRLWGPLQLNAAPMIVAIDAGHGGLGAGVWNSTNGDGAGSHGPSGLTEQWVNLRVAQLLLGDLVDDPRFAGSFLVRTSATQQVSLADRVALATQAGADFYLSIHHNGLPTGAPNRTETYFCRTNSACGDELAGEAVSTPETACLEMAWRLHDRIVDAFGYTGRGAFEDSAGTGRFHFYVLRQATMPAVLTEASNLNDPVEEGLFGLDPLERHAKAEAVALHLGLVDLAFGPTGVPPARVEGGPALVFGPWRRQGRDVRLSIQSALSGAHELSIIDPLGRRLVELGPFQGPGHGTISFEMKTALPVWLVVRHGGTIVGVQRLP